MRNYVAGVLTAGILLGALRWADLALWTDLDTGLVTAGPVWARYLALALVAGLALLVGGLPGASCATFIGKATILAFLPLNFFCIAFSTFPLLLVFVKIYPFSAQPDNIFLSE